MRPFPLKLFVGNLSWTVSRQQLKEHFTKFGSVKQASVVFNRETGLSRGFGFVDFAEKTGYDAAVNQDIHVIENKQVTIASATGKRR